LVTRSIWGKPSWGTWWEWDARLTSELILLFLYIAYISLYNSFDNHKTATKASSILAIVGLINLPIIHYSVNWWNTLHQPASISFTNNSIKDSDMLIALILMSFAFKFLYFVLVLMKAKYEILLTEQNSSWVKNIIIQLKT
jgi:heme exporter protein C